MVLPRAYCAAKCRLHHRRRNRNPTHASLFTPCCWVRAAASLNEQKDFKRALQAADKALSLDPNNADALKARAAAVEEGK